MAALDANLMRALDKTAAGGNTSGTMTIGPPVWMADAVERLRLEQSGSHSR